MVREDVGYIQVMSLRALKESDRSILPIPEEKEVSKRTVCSTDARCAQSLMSKTFGQRALLTQR